MARNVQVILTEDLPNVGRSGEVVRVKPGYARNFLIPRGLAAIATADNVHRLEHEKRVAQKRAEKQRASAQDLAGKLANLKLTLQAQVGEENRLYGAITSRDVEAALADKGFEIDRRKIVMEPIKELGSHKIPIRIAAGVDAGIELEIVARK
jgi:large subunit ribosomal protein L9